MHVACSSAPRHPGCRTWMPWTDHLPWSHTTDLSRIGTAGLHASAHQHRPHNRYRSIGIGTRTVHSRDRRGPVDGDVTRPDADEITVPAVQSVDLEVELVARPHRQAQRVELRELGQERAGEGAQAEQASDENARVESGVEEGCGGARAPSGGRDGELGDK